MSHRLSQRQMEKAPEGMTGSYQQPAYDHTPEHVTRRLPSPLPQPQHANLPPPIPYGSTTPPTPSRTVPRFVTKGVPDRLENGVVHGNMHHGNVKAPSHVGGRHLSPPPHPDMEATGDGDDIEDEDDDDMYTDVIQDNVAARPVPETAPKVSTGGGHAVEQPSAADIHRQHEHHEHGVADKTFQKESTRGDDDIGVEADGHPGGGVLPPGSTEEHVV